MRLCSPGPVVHSFSGGGGGEGVQVVALSYSGNQY